MSALRLSHPGKPTTLIQLGRETPHIQGHGGAQLGWFGGVVLTVKQKRDNQPRKRLARAPKGRPPIDGPRCGLPTRFGEPCGRRPEHAPPHKGVNAVARIAERMRG
jgi:hypothetical protein